MPMTLDVASKMLSIRRAGAQNERRRYPLVRIEQHVIIISEMKAGGKAFMYVAAISA